MKRSRLQREQSARAPEASCAETDNELSVCLCVHSARAGGAQAQAIMHLTAPYSYSSPTYLIPNSPHSPPITQPDSSTVYMVTLLCVAPLGTQMGTR